MDSRSLVPCHPVIPCRPVLRYRIRDNGTTVQPTTKKVKNQSRFNASTLTSSCLFVCTFCFIVEIAKNSFPLRLLFFYLEDSKTIMFLIISLAILYNIIKRPCIRYVRLFMRLSALFWNLSTKSPWKNDKIFTADLILVEKIEFAPLTHTQLRTNVYRVRTQIYPKNNKQHDDDDSNDDVNKNK